MPRTSKAEKQRTTVRIVETAARLFRERGLDGTGVADVMSGAGLTHGGFYRHFANKEELGAVAIRTAIQGFIDEIAAEAESDGPMAAVRAYTERYLSEAHVANLGVGCPMAALGAEIGRGPDAYRTALAEGRRDLIDLLASAFPEDDTARDRASTLLSQMVGAVTLARGDPENAAEILSAARRAVARML